MKASKIDALAAAILIAALLLGVDYARPASPAGQAHRALASASARMEGYFPNVLLKTHDNRMVRFYDDLVTGKTVLINFMFATCQGICPLSTANLAKVQRDLGEHVGRDIFLYSITLEPEKDTPEVLKSYAEAMGAKPGWVFLTGRRADIELLRRKLGL